jgi:hypothetical protein
MNDSKKYFINAITYDGFLLNLDDLTLKEAYYFCREAGLNPLFDIQEKKVESEAEK